SARSFPAAEAKAPLTSPRRRAESGGPRRHGPRRARLPRPAPFGHRTREDTAMRMVAVLGPAGSGKTTLVGQIAGLDGGDVRREESDHLALTCFSFLGEPWAALDLAGGPDWAGMAGPALMAADAALVVVPPDPSAAVLA